MKITKLPQDRQNWSVMIFLIPACIVLAIANSQAATNQTETATIRTNMAVRSLVTATEIGVMLTAAQAWGFHDIAEITIEARSDGSDTNIVLKSKEERIGRTVTSHKIAMNREHWLSHIRALADGTFLVLPNIVTTNQVTLRTAVVVNGNKIELLIPEDMTADRAGEILNTFVAGKLSYAKPELAARLKMAKLGRAQQLAGPSRDHYFRACFSCGDCCSLCATFTLTGNQITIVDISESWC